MTEKNNSFILATLASKKYFYTEQTLISWAKKKYILGKKQAGLWWIDEISLKAYLKLKKMGF